MIKKNNIFKSKIFGILILLLTISLNYGFLTTSLKQTNSTNRIQDKLTEFEQLRTNGPEINITTPENRTYIMPMSGYYPASYGFENDENEAIPEEWFDATGTWQNITGSEPNVYAEVIESYNGHNKVVELYDDVTDKFAAVARNFTAQYYGSVELWIYSTDVSLRTQVGFAQSMSVGFSLLTRNDVWEARNGNLIQMAGGGSMPAPLDNTWYHIRIDFECTTGGYQGLGQYQWKCYINGTESAAENFYSPKDYVETFRLRTNEADSGYTSYADAVGFSWDNDYTFGDNMDEGLLLSYKTSFSVNWTCYSLDNQVNKTILGNTTITMPNDGIHRIQVFGNDSLGANYESDIRYFTIKAIRIITPKNKTYIMPMSGYYPASYGFENDENEAIPEEWFDATGTWQNITGSEPNVYAEVIESYNGHNKVVELYDDVTDKFAAVARNFTAQYYGSVELWIYSTDVSLRTQVGFAQSMSVGFSLLTRNDVWEARNGNLIQMAGGGSMPAPLDNTWYHIRIDFECTTGGYQGLGQYQWKCYINGTESAAENFYSPKDYVETFRLRTNEADSGYTSYADAVGFSWDNDYTFGDNMDEGLFLSFDSRYNEWLSYSLDGQANKTILGNTTIPMPNDGIHRIQVFGNDSLGANYESDIRYFSIDTSPPEITIIKPNQDEFFGITAPDFELSINEMNPNISWYTIDNGITNITFSGLTGSINQTEWDKKGDVSITIRFYANDTWGFEGYSQVIVSKDTMAPVSSIYFIPHSGIDIVNESTTFTIIADDGIGSGVSIIRYKINESSWIDYTGPFTLSNYPYGDLLISYQAIDQVDNYESIQTLLVERTDTIAPTSSLLFTPYSGTNEVIKSTTFTIIADDSLGSGVSIIHYKINDSGWIPYTGAFNLSNYDYGDYMITYQAIDNVGNIEAENTQLVKLVEQPSEPSEPIIHGYNLWILIGIISLASLLIIAKKFKN
ncbi:MAG: OmpL47-type beta-barrel domain-containing protein [Promethearchaeota archaeon]